MSRFLVHWFATAVALAFTAWLLPGVHVASVGALVVGSLALGLINALIRPVLSLLTLPVTVLTLGLFALVTNGVCFALAAWMVPGFGVDSACAAIGGGLVVSIVSALVGGTVEDRPRHRERERPEREWRER